MRSLLPVAAIAQPSPNQAPDRTWITDVRIISPEKLDHIEKGSVLLHGCTAGGLQMRLGGSMKLPQVLCWSVAAAAALARRAKITPPFVDLRILNICPLLERAIKRPLHARSGKHSSNRKMLKTHNLMNYEMSGFRHYRNSLQCVAGDLRKGSDAASCSSRELQF